MSTKEPARGKEVSEGGEDLESLPIGDPQAGYLAPKPGTDYGVGTLPDVEQDAKDEAADEWEAEAQAVAEAEDAAVKVRNEEGSPKEEAKTTKASAPTSGSSGAS